jgi:hypothetical protein
VLQIGAVRGFIPSIQQTVDLCATKQQVLTMTFTPEFKSSSTCCWMMVALREE